MDNEMSYGSDYKFITATSATSGDRVELLLNSLNKLDQEFDKIAIPDNVGMFKREVI